MFPLSVLLVLVSFSGAFGDQGCLDRSGRCQADTISCLGGYKSKLCNGASNRRCCLPAQGDSGCTQKSGFCQEDKLSCPGEYRSRLCAGGSNRRCCLPKAGGSCLTSSEMKALQNKLIEYEGLKYTAYDAQPKNKKVIDWTICVGFNLERKEARNVFSKILPGVSFDAVYAGTKSLTKTQCLALFESDLTKTYIPRAKKAAGNKFCGFPQNVKIALVSAVYRGDLAYKHNTAKLIRVGKWCSVRAEYLDNNQYKNCVKLGIPGVCTRMNWNADQFQSMC